ncbi:YggT family protein [Solibacillus sp. MA9]|uniref:YggT family protein n=1 Tax=Solibacillus palustris TaxID=2908203 RepID=A0ABS9U942_9BACL|nr:YggT family protein [Solibacillus sp. MA9]MCH7320851.1 YggT family protein [Solibacillus sp. MA9]
MIIFGVVKTIFIIYRYMLIGYILMSWVPALQESAVGRFLEKVCEPYLGFFRKFIPPIGMIDISPIVGLFVLYFIERGVYNVLIFLL